MNRSEEPDDLAHQLRWELREPVVEKWPCRAEDGRLGRPSSGRVRADSACADTARLSRRQRPGGLFLRGPANRPQRSGTLLTSTIRSGIRKTAASRRWNERVSYTSASRIRRPDARSVATAIVSAWTSSRSIEGSYDRVHESGPDHLPEIAGFESRHRTKRLRQLTHERRLLRLPEPARERLAPVVRVRRGPHPGSASRRRSRRYRARRHPSRGCPASRAPTM